jgi:hypothetical protein
MTRVSCMVKSIVKTMLLCSFPMSCKSLEVFDNEDQTRAFLALGVAAGREQVRKGLRAAPLLLL